MKSQVLKLRRNQTTQRIFNAATKAFSDAGFAGARMDKIAKNAKVNKATICYHIGDKQALYEKVLQNLFGDVAEQLTHNVNAVLPAEEKLKMFIRTIAGIIDQNPELAAIMLREQASGGRHFPEIVAQDLAGILGLLTKILDNGVKTDVFEETVPLIVHMMIISTIVFFKMTSPIRAKIIPLVANFQNIDNNISGKVTTEIEKLILNAVKK